MFSIIYLKGGWTALLRCAENGHVDAIKILLDAGSNIEATENVSQIRCLVVYQCTQIVSLLYDIIDIDVDIDMDTDIDINSDTDIDIDTDNDIDIDVDIDIDTDIDINSDTDIDID